MPNPDGTMTPEEVVLYNQAMASAGQSASVASVAQGPTQVSEDRAAYAAAMATPAYAAQTAAQTINPNAGMSGQQTAKDNLGVFLDEWGRARGNPQAQQDLLAKLQKTNPNFVEALNSVAGADYGYDIPGQEHPANQTLYASAADKFLARLDNFYLSKTQPEAWDARPLKSSTPIPRDNGGIPVLDAIMTGGLSLLADASPTAAITDALDFNSSTPGELALGVAPESPSVVPNIGEPINFMNPDMTATDVRGPGVGGGLQSNFESAGALAPVDKANFEVQRVDQPWTTPEQKAMLEKLYADYGTAGQGTAPTISEGSAGMLAAYDEAMRRQQSAQTGVSSVAAGQQQLFQGMGGDLSLYQAAARGNAPSVAQIQMQQGLTQAQRGAMSVAATARDPGAWYRASRQQGVLANDAVAQTSLLRAQEMEQARAGLANYYGVQSGAGAAAAQGAAAAASAQGEISQEIAVRLAQQQGISVEQAKTQLEQQRLNDVAKANAASSLTNAQNARTSALQGQSAENATVATGTQKYAETKSQQDVATRGQDVSAAASVEAARLSSEASRVNTLNMLDLKREENTTQAIGEGVKTVAASSGGS